MSKYPIDSSRVDFEASATGLKLGATGGGAARLSEALADLLSPFSNVAGLAGDIVANARREAAFRAARKGIEMLEKEGITSGDVPPKILLPWLDGASLETEGKASLEDAWAGLLARAVKSSDAVLISYMEALKRIGAKEAELLWFFASDTSPSFSEKFYDPMLSGGFDAESINPVDVVKSLDKITDVEKFSAHMETFGLQLMSQVIYYSVGNSSTITTAYFDENEQVVANLEHLGLIKIGKRRFVGARIYVIHWFEITKFGFDMMWACRGAVTGKAAAKNHHEKAKK